MIKIYFLPHLNLLCEKGSLKRNFSKKVQRNPLMGCSLFSNYHFQMGVAVMGFAEHFGHCLLSLPRVARLAWPHQKASNHERATTCTMLTFVCRCVCKQVPPSLVLLVKLSLLHRSCFVLASLSSPFSNACLRLLRGARL